jgi:hypothetical protein
LAKTDDVLLALSRTIPEFIRSVGSFQYRGKTYRLVNNFASSQYMKCSLCGNYPIFDVSVIKGLSFLHYNKARREVSFILLSAVLGV